MRPRGGQFWARACLLDHVVEHLLSRVGKDSDPLGIETSALLVMAISGAAILPPLQGAFADRWGMQASFLVPLLAMAYVAAYAWYKYRNPAPVYTPAV